VVVDENGLASCPPTRFDIAPAVANHETLAELDTPVDGGGQEHSWLRLPAVAAVRIIVVAYSKVIKPDAATQEVVDLLDTLARHASAGDIGLVSDDDQKKPVAAQPIARLGHAPGDLHFI
jgi:hypothetical protein